MNLIQGQSALLSQIVLKNKLLTYCEKQIEQLSKNSSLVENTLSIGEYGHPKKGYNATEVAALMKTILIIYNLEETITKS